MATLPLDLSDAATALRRLRADEAPYPGELHADPAVVWVDLELVPEELWRCAPDGHLLVPLDLARTHGGHAAVVPHCAERLASVVDGSCSEGAAVTITVSMLRAAAEARAHELTGGSWWVDASGRPVLAITGTAPWEIEARTLLARLAAGVSRHLGAEITRAAELIAAERLPETALVGCEDALFSLASPAPLGTRASVRADGAPPMRADALRRPAELAPAESWIARVTDADWAARVMGAVGEVTSALSHLRERRAAGSRSATRRARVDTGTSPVPPPNAPHRRRAWLIAGAVAMVVVAAGLLWPDPSSPATARPVAEPSSSPEAGAEPGGDAQDPAPAASAEPDDLEAVARRALAALAACAAAAAASCAAAMEDPSAPTPHGIVTRGADGPTVTLVDEYGGVAVIRVEESEADSAEAGGEPSQILVLVSADGKWLVRDVYDVADQP